MSRRGRLTRNQQAWAGDRVEVLSVIRLEPFDWNLGRRFGEAKKSGIAGLYLAFQN